ncbi:MAG TPA: hypothetical protein VF615_25735 [Longimicrobiaceae bacterium]|jgi:hypothetical protein
MQMQAEVVAGATMVPAAGDPAPERAAVARKPGTYLIFDFGTCCWLQREEGQISPDLLEAGLFDREQAAEIVSRSPTHLESIPLADKADEIRRLAVAAERMQWALGFAVRAVTCVRCGCEFSDDEAAAARETCMDCAPVDVSTPEGVALRVLRALQANPLFLSHVMNRQPAVLHLETEAGDEFVLEVQPALTVPERPGPDLSPAEALEVMIQIWGFGVVPLETIESWSDAVIEQAARYVSAAIADANDNDVPAEQWPEPPAELQEALGARLPHPSRRRTRPQEA